jgi:hypothetical protein
MQIQTTNSQQVALSKLSLSQQEFVKQRLEPQIKILNDNQVKRGLKDILCQASFDMGSPMAEDLTVLTFQIESCFNELKGKFGTMTLSEVRSAFRRGIRGEYGAYFGMCPKTYHQFIKAYFEMPERFKAHDEYLKLVEMEENPKELTTEQKKEIGRHGAIRRFEDYKKTGELGFIPSATYNILNDLIGVEYTHPVKGLIKTLILDTEVRKSIFADCKSVYLADLNKHKSKAALRKDTDMVEDLNYLIANFAGQNTFENMVKDKMLKYYFDTLIKNNQPLNI